MATREASSAGSAACAAAGVAMVKADHSATPPASTPRAPQRCAAKPPSRLVTCSSQGWGEGVGQGGGRVERERVG